MKRNYIINASKDLILESTNRLGLPKVAISGSEKLNLNINHSFSAFELFECNYDLNINELAPVDSVLLDKLNHCEVQYLKMCDRINIYGGYQKRKDDYISHIRYWNHVIINEGIDFCIFMNPPHEGYDFVLYSLCKLHNVRTFMFYHLPHRPGFTFIYCFEDIQDHMPGLKNRYFEIKSQDKRFSFQDISYPLNRFLIEQIDNNGESLVKVDGSEFGYTNSILKNILKKALNFLRSFSPNSQQGFRKKIENYINGNILRDAYFDSPEKVMKFYNHNAIEPEFDQEYIYLALHYQPECSSSPLAGQYVDQGLVVEMLSKASPEKLIYVKDHPRIGNIFKNKAFFKRILSFPNVRLISFKSDTHNLIKNAFAVSTLTGTVGLEALVRGIPVLMFGNRYYEHAPGIYKINSFHSLKNSIADIEKNFKFDLNNVLCFFKALEGFVFEGVLEDPPDYISDLKHSNTCKKMIDEIQSRL